MDVSVKVLGRRGDSVLVEWLDGDDLQRGYLPADEIQDDLASSDVLELAIPYGLPWSEIIQLRATSEAMEKQLHKIGVWTEEDLQTKSMEVVGALQAVYQVDLANLRRLTKQYLEGVT